MPTIRFKAAYAPVPGKFYASHVNRRTRLCDKRWSPLHPTALKAVPQVPAQSGAPHELPEWLHVPVQQKQSSEPSPGCQPPFPPPSPEGIFSRLFHQLRHPRCQNFWDDSWTHLWMLQRQAHGLPFPHLHPPDRQRAGHVLSQQSLLLLSASVWEEDSNPTRRTIISHWKQNKGHLLGTW